MRTTGGVGGAIRGKRGRQITRRRGRDGITELSLLRDTSEIIADRGKRPKVFER